MLCASIRGPTINEIREQIEKAISFCSLVELRIDLFEKIDIEEIKKLRSDYHVPMLFSLRSQKHGGGFGGSEESRYAIQEQLAVLQPEYMDIQYPVNELFLKQLKQMAPECQFILSYHNFDDMDDFEETYGNMRRQQDVDLYKIAVTPHCFNDTANLIKLLQQYHSDSVIIGMGAWGRMLRILAPIYGAKINFVSIDKAIATAPGQLTLAEMREIYHFDKLSRKTRVYCLLTDNFEENEQIKQLNDAFLNNNLEAIVISVPVKHDEILIAKKQLAELNIEVIQVSLSSFT